MNKAQIDDIICLIMYRDGPDMHVDGHEFITDFVWSLLKNKGTEWHEKYLDGNIPYTHFYWRKKINRGK